MKRNVLIVHPDEEMTETIERLLKQTRAVKDHDLSVSCARSLTSAEQIAGTAERVDLLVTALEISEDDKTSMAAGEQGRRGMELIRKLRAANPATAAILITREMDNNIIAFSQANDAGLVMDGAGFADQLESQIVARLAAHEPQPPERVDLVICLSVEKGCYYQFQPHGEPPRDTRILAIPHSKLKALLDQSRDLDVWHKSWKGNLQRLGEALAEDLFQGTPDSLQFRDDFHFWLGKCGIKNIRVRFVVEDTLHEIPVEALKQSEEDHWMLQTAVYRGPYPFQQTLEPRGLFKDKETRDRPINFLIIQADVPEVDVVIEGRAFKVGALPNLAGETSVVTALLSKLKKERVGQPIIGKVRVISKAEVSAGGSFQTLVEDVLKEQGPWHVVHYAGHTYYDHNHKVGYFIFPGSGIAPVEPIKIDLFAYFLTKTECADTRFVFLSSCEGAQQDFIYHLLKEGVPAIMGFLWRVDDPTAKEYAKSFYHHLLEGKERSLEYACLEAKREMHAKYGNNPIWASAVLVMQA